MSDPATERRVYRVVLVLLLILGVALRFYGLTIQSYWLDELYSASVAAPTNTALSIVQACARDAHPPLYEFLLWAAYHIFGYTEWVGRALSALFGAMGLGMIFLLARLLWDRSAALLALAMTVPLFFHVYYSQEVRSYALVFLLTAWCWHAAVRLVMSPRWRRLFLYVVVSLLLVYTHYFGWFVLLAQAVYLTGWLVLDMRERWRVYRWFVAAGVVVVVGYLPWLVPMVGNKLLDPAKTWIQPVSLRFPLDYTKAYFGRSFHFIWPAALLGLWFRYRAKNRLQLAQDSRAFLSPAPLFFTWIGVTWFVPYVLSFVTAPMLIPRATMVTVPAMVLLPCGLAARLPLKRAAQVALVVVFLMTGSLLSKDRYYIQSWKEDWRSTVRYVMAVDPAGNIPVLAHWDYNFEAYFRMLGDERDVVRPRVNTFVRRAVTLPQNGSVWVLKSHLMQDIDLGVVDLLDVYFEPVARWQTDRSEATLWRFRGPDQRGKLAAEFRMLIPSEQHAGHEQIPSADDVRQLLNDTSSGPDIPFDPGSRILFTQGGWRGVFTRKGNGPVYHGEWRHESTGRVIHDELEMRHCSLQRIILYRKGMNGCYRGVLSPDGRTAFGIADWYTWDGVWRMTFPEPKFENIGNQP